MGELHEPEGQRTTLPCRERRMRYLRGLASSAVAGFEEGSLDGHYVCVCVQVRKCVVAC